ncbi:MAG: hypothetical protein ACWA41_10275 [Putridiphycobacter sp.]
MKKTMFALFGAALLMAAPSCKKGENDPALSLKTRKGRLAGEYTITSIEGTSTYTSGSNTSTTTTTFDGSNYVESQTSNGTTVSNTSTVTLAEMTFSKDGTWTRSWNETRTEIDDQTSYKQTDVIDTKMTMSGTWAFVGKTKDQSKNKERVQLSVLEYTNDETTNTTFEDKIFNTTTNSSSTSSDAGSYAYLEYVMVYDIDMLKSKEMVFKSVEDDSYSNSYTSGNTTTTTTSTYTGEETITLTQK